jgi:Tfp pilus tip-associated adhesin PilY1
VAASRAATENAIYSASFQIIPNGPLWLGHLNKYTINADGSVGGEQWDAGASLQAKDSSTRNIITYRGDHLIQFTGPDWGIWKDYLGVHDGNTAQAIIGYIRGDSGSNPDNWKLGDIFHSNLVTIGKPSIYFNDPRDANHSFDTFRSNQQSRTTIIVAGANDGQFHAFDSGGNERWSFIPPNLQAKLQYLAHPSRPTALQHTYFVDGPVTVADIWLGSGDNTAKSASDWHTLLVFGEGRGVRDSSNSSPAYLWSSSSNCDANLAAAYDASKSPYYCGYYALDVTNTGASQPRFMWRLNPNSTQAQYLGEPWSKMAIGRVWYNGNEKWVGFIGGGYNTVNDSRGKGFFVVDLSNGNILWSFTSSGMTYSIPSSPAIVDTDNDGFIDTAYVGDLGGNVWRFTFCTREDGPSCTWYGAKFFDATYGGSGSIYTAPSLARDGTSLWVFWGTGDRETPNSTSRTDHFFALKDSNRSTIYTINNLQNVSGTGTIYNRTSTFGWYITLAGTGEKNLSDSFVFGGFILFTTYIPPVAANPCNSTGTSNLYAMAMMRFAAGGITYDPGAGVLTPGSSSNTAGGTRSVSLGAGMAKEPVFSQKPTGGPTDLYIAISGGAGWDTSIIAISSSNPDNPLKNTQPLNDLLKITAPSAQILHWRDGRIQ